MHYCISDIHGWLDKYEKVLNYVKNEDTLYILGDVIDRGKDGLKILNDIEKRKNIVFIVGNHELFLYNYLKSLNNEFENKKVKAVWTMECNGGTVTKEQVDLLSNEEKLKIQRFLEDSYLIKRVEIKGTKYHLSHSYTLFYIKNDLKFRDTTNSEKRKVVWNSVFPRRSDPFGKTIDDTGEIYIFGHTPVQKVKDNAFDYKIIHEYKNAEFYDIDCGCAYGEDFSRLALFCLEDKSVIYF